MSRLWIASLFVVLVVLPAQSRISMSCACTIATPTTSNTMDVASDSCCSVPMKTSSPSPDAPDSPDDHGRAPCDECPRPCCTVLKMTIAPPTVAREHPRAAAPAEYVAPDDGHVRSAHLDRLERPPQPLTSAS